ncbi:hypothetical protein G4V62_11805 [Bacillaceae bacterium SIJ1]|uniref:glycosyltransferase family protein n=1 Tax=Litoribacterium kuwaitense TaxID=1398745 RepID=UPI0013EDFB23|nr:glycosyltransferase family protein [Litoribacterium kuwaitense]NGP45605.1 hypothetical protein [Litoribacterium kuwaitense]
MSKIHIVYYISDEGASHMARSAVVAEELLLAMPNLHITFVHRSMIRYLKRRFFKWKDRVAFRSLPFHLNYVYEKNHFTIDQVKMAEHFDIYKLNWSMMHAEETAFLKELKPHLVLSDIEAVAFSAADEAGVYSIGMSHVTWHSVMTEVLMKKATFLRDAYEKMDVWIALPGGNEPSWGNDKKFDLGWFATPTHLQRVRKLRRRWKLFGQSTKLIFIDFGDQSNHWSIPETWVSESTMFIVSSGLMTGSPYVIPVPRFEPNPQDYLAAADWMIARPNWSLVANAVLSNTPVRLVGHSERYEERQLCANIERNQFGETHLINHLKDIQRLPLSQPLRTTAHVENELPKLISILLSFV